MKTNVGSLACRIVSSVALVGVGAAIGRGVVTSVLAASVAFAIFLVVELTLAKKD